MCPEPTRMITDRRSCVARSYILTAAAGTRRCIGMAFATYEMKMVHAETLLRAELRAAPGKNVRLVRRSITFAPSAGMPVVLEKRAA